MRLIQKRFYDKISHVRAKALKKFIKIVRSDQITLEPFDLYASILGDTASKMRDQTANVRKNALKLFSQLIHKFTSKTFDLQKYYNGRFPTKQDLDIEQKTYTEDNMLLKERLAKLCEDL